MNVYCISGLGADRRAFELLFPSGEVELTFIDWKKPLDNETLENYARRMAADIDVSNPYILIGLSFGGMVASIMNEFLQPAKTILISSIASNKELRLSARLAGKLKLNRLMPYGLTREPSKIVNWIFGLEKQEHIDIMQDMRNRADILHSRWSVDKIINWKKKESNNAIVRIHGSHDKVLPIRNFKPGYLIRGGGHLIIFTHADQVTEILKLEIEKTEQSYRGITI